MSKTVNLTIRVEPKLLHEARVAAAYLDTDLSKRLRDAMRTLVKDYFTQHELDTRRARLFVEGDLAQHAHQALTEKIKANGGAMSVGLGGRLVPDREAPGAKDGVQKLLEGDTSCLTRKQRRQFERDRAKGRV